MYSVIIIRFNKLQRSWNSLVFPIETQNAGDCRLSVRDWVGYGPGWPQ